MSQLHTLVLCALLCLHDMSCHVMSCRASVIIQAGTQLIAVARCASSAPTSCEWCVAISHGAMQNSSYLKRMEGFEQSGNVTWKHCLVTLPGNIAW